MLGADFVPPPPPEPEAPPQPWYLRPNYNQSEILIDPDGTVRGGTVQALVERLTAHEHGGRLFFSIRHVHYPDRRPCRPDIYQGLLDDIQVIYDFRRVI